jgi:AcrR family transcriptional regulator
LELVERSYNKRYAGANPIYRPGLPSGFSMAVKDIAYNRKTAQQRRSELIAAGVACLGRGGMSAFTIDQICKQAGVSRGLINHHFDSKEALLVSIYAQMTEYLVREHAAATPRQQIASLIDDSFDAASFNKSNLRAWLAIWGQVATHAELKSLYRLQLVDALTAIADAEQLAIDAASIARQLIALIDGLWLEYCLHSDGFSLDDARADCYRFLQGIGIVIQPEQELPERIEP